MSPDRADLARRHEQARRRAERLGGLRASVQADLERQAERETRLTARIGRAGDVEEALERLVQTLFDDIMSEIERHLSLALSEVLRQDLQLKIDYKPDGRAGATLDFAIERGGERENLMRGQGGSVANILSVGLRLFALQTLDPARHRPFLLLDEPDCWLRPDLAPALARIISESGERLGVQTLFISHHDTALFEAAAARVFRFELRDGRVRCRAADPLAAEPNPEPASELGAEQGVAGSEREDAKNAGAAP